MPERTCSPGLIGFHLLDCALQGHMPELASSKAAQADLPDLEILQDSAVPGPPLLPAASSAWSTPADAQPAS